MAGFVLVTELRCGVSAAFEASLDIDLHLASMSASGERAVAGVTTGMIGPGETVTWQARHFGVPWHMTCRITAYNRPHGFVDEQISGPFRRWRHQHQFQPVDDGTRMTDVVDFEAPAGPLGRIVAAGLLRPYLRRLIVRRNMTLADAVQR